MFLRIGIVLSASACFASYDTAQSSTTSSSATGTTVVPSATVTLLVPTKVDDCHKHSDGYYCFQGQLEWEVTSDIGNTAEAPDSYSQCTAAENADTIKCADGSGGQVTLVREGTANQDDHDHGHAASSGASYGTTVSSTSSVSSTPSMSTAAAATPSVTAVNAGNMLLPASGLSVLVLGALLAI